MAYRSRSIIDAPADAPPDAPARPPCPQISQWYPRVAKGSSKRPLARTPCPQVSQWHLRVAKGSSNRHSGTATLPTGTSVAFPRGEGGLLSGLWHGHLAHKYLSGIPTWRRGSSKRPSARTPCPQVSQWHPRVAKGVCMGYGGIGGSNALRNSGGLSLSAISDRGSSDGMKPSPHTSSPDGRNWHTDGSRFLLAE